MSVATFMEKHYRHFNARETLDAAKSYVEFLGKGNKMFLAMAGAMSTGEIGIILARMIREGKVHAISCTAANLEEDIFNLVAHDEYKVIPNWRALSDEDEVQLLQEGFNRVTDTCIPETVMKHIDTKMVGYWKEAAERGESYFPCEYFYRLIEDGVLEKHRQIPREHSWLIAAYEEGIPVYSPGWEDSTMGNSFASEVIGGRVQSHNAVRHGTEQMEHLVRWYAENTKEKSEVGFFQIGGGIAGDFAICAVPLMIQDIPTAEAHKPHREKLVADPDKVKLWGYFCQISDAVTSYGGYSGAVPNEKITWCKLSKECPKFMIQSDASIVAPLVFEYVLERSGQKGAKVKIPAKKTATVR
jgi:deoxyhypusine synthase